MKELMMSREFCRTGRPDFLGYLFALWLFSLGGGGAYAQICQVRDTLPSVPVRQVYVIAGQSNAVGLASVRNYVSGSKDYVQEGTVYPNVKIYGIYGAPAGVAGNDDAEHSVHVNWRSFAGWHMARPGFGYKNFAGVPGEFPRNTRAVDLFGPEVYFSHFLNSRRPFDHYIVKLAVSNAALSPHSTRDSWSHDGRLFNQLLAMIADAYNSKRTEVRLRVAGLFFMQGETDALDLVSARNYENNLRKFIKAFRREVVARGCADDRFFPVVLGRIQDNKAWTHRKYVRRAQQKVGRSAKSIRLVNTDDFSGEMIAGGVHFNEYGQAHLGARVYRAFFALRPSEERALNDWMARR
ncbi:sialate O-acetylesterase [Paenacidovorax monticola]|uniref:Sialate O-acetylesterase domain-containing protein n=1 Tax=Paenacidovorax monticola TaxID=1926868 RepID=A0A7H0HBE0_9BURK|nr:sialate O-acetylesterase [Paenacidovorax monticola]QNP57856.1 hypothetical protein H9L24_12005 [Paenacidovorax monticola]